VAIHNLEKHARKIEDDCPIGLQPRIPLSGGGGEKIGRGSRQFRSQNFFPPARDDDVIVEKQGKRGGGTSSKYRGREKGRKISGLCAVWNSVRGVVTFSAWVISRVGVRVTGLERLKKEKV